MSEGTMTTAESKQAELGYKPITGLMVRMAVPGIIAQLINIYIASLTAFTSDTFRVWAQMR